MERFSLLLNIADQPAWLKAVVLSFALLEASPVQPAASSLTLPPSEGAAAPVAGPSGSPSTPEVTRCRASGLRVEQGDEPPPALNTSPAKRHRKQGKKRTRLRASRFDGSPRFARSPEAAAPAPELDSSGAVAAAAAAASAEGLLDSAPAVVPAGTQPVESAPAVASCSGAVGGETRREPFGD